MDLDKDVETINLKAMKTVFLYSSFVSSYDLIVLLFFGNKSV